MRATVSLLSLVVVVAIGLFIYRSSFTEKSGVTMGTQNPRAAMDITGVEMDLNAMAQAERAFQALNGRYASLQEMYSSGSLQADPARGRQGYTYSAEVSDRHFSITATYNGPATDMPTLSIDETMHITRR
ncbi:MAG: hypothetical protein HY313_01825 [Acidobacteria bacterium]|nr:hypothetical protein [Acidobacteriota bacterium]